MFTALPKQFKMFKFIAIPMLDRESFRLETQYASSVANNRDEFYEMLQSRIEARRKEYLGD